MTDITILHLYPKEMNLYGDHGNILTLRRRCEWRGIGVRVISCEPGDPFPEHVDLLFGGGGQDSGQSRIEEDLQRRAEDIRALVEDGTPALVICGLYQLFGTGFLTSEGQNIQGIGALPAHTVAGDGRLIGNICVHSGEFGDIIGFENHSGLTYLDGAQPLGTTKHGEGNNGKDNTEGARYRNCIGTYLHGPVLPKNPALADFLILKALQRRHPAITALTPLDDTIETAAHREASLRPR